MNIQEKPAARRIDVRSKSSGNSINTSHNTFFKEIQHHENEIETFNKEIDDIRKEIDSAGEKITTEPTLTNFKKFRFILSRLASRMNAEAYRLEKFGGTPQNPRYYEIITTINSEADKLYHLIIKEQKDNLAITASVIGIKGLVVDLIS